MKHLYQCALRCLLAVGAAGLLALSSATAQRTDSLMTKSDVIIPLFGAPTVNGFLYYVADDGKTGYELWRTNGTTAGTTLVKDIRPGKSSAFVSDSTFYYYATYNSTTGRYDIDATKLKNSLRAFLPYVLNNILYFWADDGTNGIELWRSDGTEAGTRIVVDLIPGPLSTGNQYDILVGNSGYLGGVNGGYTNGSYSSSKFATNQGKLLFWSNNVSNVVWETNGTAAGTREINVQTTKYRNVSPFYVTSLNGRLFINTLLYEKGTYYYSVVQDNGTPTPIPVVVNSANRTDVIASDARGLVLSTSQDDGKQVVYSITRRDSVTAKTKVLKQITFAKPTTGSSNQYVNNYGQSGNQVFVLARDEPYARAGKGRQDLWRLDLSTDSVQVVRSFAFEQTYAGNQYGYLKGSERFYNQIKTPTGPIFQVQTADSTATAGKLPNRNTFYTYAASTNKLQVLEDSVEATNYYQPIGTGGKLLFLTRKNPKDAYRTWLTDGKQKQTIKTLGSYDYGPGMIPTEAGLVGVGYTVNYDANKKPSGTYKVDVWKFDSTAAGTTRVGQQANGGGVGTVVASGGTLYGIGSTILKLSAAPSDSIRRLADIRNYADIGGTQVNGDYLSSTLGTINGRQIGKRYGGDNLLVIDPAAKPRQCLITAFPTANSRDRLNNWSSRVIVLAPGKDSLMTLKRQPATSDNYRGDVSQIYYQTLQWVRDSTVLLSGTTDSLRVRQPGIYRLSLRGVADGCTANSTFQVYNDLPKAQIQRRSPLYNGDGSYLVANVSGGYPFGVNGTTPYYNSVWEYTTADGAVKSIPGGQVYAAGGRTELSNVSIKDGDLGTYSLKVTDYATSTAVAALTIDAAGVAFKARADSPYNRKATCAGVTVPLSLTVVGGKTPYTVRWLTAGVPVPGLTGPNPTFTAATSQTTVTNPDYTYYTAEITDADGRKVLSDDALIPVYPNPISTLTASGSALTTGQAVTLTVGTANYQYPTYVWARDGAVVTGVAGKSLTATQAGVYSVTVGSGTAEGCKTLLSTTLKTGSGRQSAPSPAESGPAPSGVAPAGSRSVYAMPTYQTNEESKPVLRVMPNPSEGPLRIEMALPRPAPIKGRILSPQGTVVEQWNEPRPQSSLNVQTDLSAQPTGLYIIQVEADGKMHTGKVIKK